MTSPSTQSPDSSGSSPQGLGQLDEPCNTSSLYRNLTAQGTAAMPEAEQPAGNSCVKNSSDLDGGVQPSSADDGKNVSASAVSVIPDGKEEEQAGLGGSPPPPSDSQSSPSAAAANGESAWPTHQDHVGETLSSTAVEHSNANASSVVSNEHPASPETDVVSPTLAASTSAAPGAEDEGSQGAVGGAKQQGASSSCPGQEVSSTYYVKWITFNKNRVPIITQNENGPCPLLAITNVLLLKVYWLNICVCACVHVWACVRACVCVWICVFAIDVCVCVRKDGCRKI